MHHETTLAESGITLEPLALRHSEPLAELITPRIWQGFVGLYPGDPLLYREYAETLIVDPSIKAFAVLNEGGDVVGQTTLYDIVESQERCEIGHTWYAERAWGTRVNPAAKLALLRHAFDELGMHRVALRCDARNERSAAAIAKLGARYEGRLRGHRHPATTGGHFDTLYFSVLAPEWPTVRQELEARLEE